ncbi:MAG: helix-turn-helix domain-containing protein [Prevotellaceae bacterium]|jgi:HTH-type transcriptional regulator/antitoxin HigA|nr:helix-turn-helix domain-containing protein [Prevotellaceae bacterium]
MKKISKNNSKPRTRAGYKETKTPAKRTGDSPLVRIIRQEMQKRHIKQKEMAKLLDFNDSSFSLFMHGKRHLSLEVAKNLYERIGLDPKLILEYA